MANGLQRRAQNLIQSALFLADELAAAEEPLPPEKRPKDVQSLARERILARRLVKYQAGLIYAGKSQGLLMESVGSQDAGHVLVEQGPLRVGASRCRFD